MTDSLGSLKKMLLRSQWTNEPQDFTPWLADEMNIRLLGDVLGVELEVEKTEAKVGPYSADILAKTALGEFVVIENRLEKCDHDHIGKALTYASVLEAKTVIWVAPKFSVEHLRAIDWLNDISSADISFFAVEIELWQIDDSRPAVRFNRVSRPIDMIKQQEVQRLSEDSLSDKRQKQLKFWTDFRNTLITRNILSNPRTPQARYWFDIPLGHSLMYLSNIANTWDNKIGVRVYLSARNGFADIAVPILLEHKAQIEADLGLKLDWGSNQDTKDKTIGVYKEFDFYDDSRWDEGVIWMAETVKQFRTVFIPFIKTIRS